MVCQQSSQLLHRRLNKHTQAMPSPWSFSPLAPHPWAPIPCHLAAPPCLFFCCLLFLFRALPSSVFYVHCPRESTRQTAGLRSSRGLASIGRGQHPVRRCPPLRAPSSLKARSPRSLLQFWPWPPCDRLVLSIADCVGDTSHVSARVPTVHPSRRLLHRYLSSVVHPLSAACAALCLYIVSL